MKKLFRASGMLFLFLLVVLGGLVSHPVSRQWLSERYVVCFPSGGDTKNAMAEEAVRMNGEAWNRFKPDLERMLDQQYGEPYDAVDVYGKSAGKKADLAFNGKWKHSEISKIKWEQFDAGNIWLIAETQKRSWGDW